MLNITKEARKKPAKSPQKARKARKT